MHWVMIVDLEKCSGCQTCTVACKVENGLGPSLGRVKVYEKESGSYPQVKRVFFPKRCMNCADPLCLKVCPSGATTQRADGIVTVNKDKCLGCRYCIMACPYNARTYYGRELSYHDHPSPWETIRYGEHPLGVVDKCDFCVDRIEQGLAASLIAGRDEDATPFCVNACIAKALSFGDLDDEESLAAALIKSRSGFRLLPEMNTDPSVYYLGRRYG